MILLKDFRGISDFNTSNILIEKTVNFCGTEFLQRLSTGGYSPSIPIPRDPSTLSDDDWGV